MRQCRDSACGKFPLKADHDVSENQQQNKNGCEAALLPEFLADLRSDKLDTSQIDVRFISRERVAQGLTQCIRISARLRRQSYQHLGWGTESLHLHIVKARVAKKPPDSLEVGLLRIADFEQHAARKVDAELQTFCHNRCKRDNDCQYRDRDSDPPSAKAQEIDGSLFFDQAHRYTPIPARWQAGDRRKRG